MEKSLYTCDIKMPAYGEATGIVLAENAKEAENIFNEYVPRHGNLRSEISHITKSGDIGNGRQIVVVWHTMYDYLGE